MKLHIKKQGMSRIHVAPGQHHYHALFRDNKRHISVVATKRTTEPWECVVFRADNVMGVFRVERCTEGTVAQGVSGVLDQAILAA